MQIYWDVFSINVLNCQINNQFPQGVKLSYGTDSPSSSMLFYIYIYIFWSNTLDIWCYIIYLSHLLVVSAENNHQVIFIVYNEHTQ